MAYSAFLAFLPASRTGSRSTEDCKRTDPVAACSLAAFTAFQLAQHPTGHVGWLPPEFLAPSFPGTMRRIPSPGAKNEQSWQAPTPRTLGTLGTLRTLAPHPPM